MAKAKQKAQVEATETENDAAEGEAKKGGKKIVLVVDGKEIPRVDYIRQRADEGASRGTIAKELTELQGKNVPYQIVFAATKDHPTYAKSKKGETTETDETSETTEE